MSGLAKSLSEIKGRVNNPDICPVERIMKTLDSEDRTALISVMKSTASTRSIHQALRAAGHQIDRQLLGLHRKGLCLCALQEEEVI